MCVGLNFTSFPSENYWGVNLLAYLLTYLTDYIVSFWSHVNKNQFWFDLIWFSLVSRSDDMNCCLIDICCCCCNCRSLQRWTTLLCCAANEAGTEKRSLCARGLWSSRKRWVLHARNCHIKCYSERSVQVHFVCLIQENEMCFISVDLSVTSSPVVAFVAWNFHATNAIASQ